jgi:hypothetical protein
VKGKPLWKSGFDRLERVVGGPLERFVQTATFAKTGSTLLKIQSATRNNVERQLGSLWHLANLPTRTDLARLRGQVSKLDRDVQTMKYAVEDEGRDRDRAERQLVPPSTDTDGPGHADPQGDRTQRPSRP